MFHKDITHMLSLLFIGFFILSPAGVLWGRECHWPSLLTQRHLNVDKHYCSLPQVSAENEVS